MTVPREIGSIYDLEKERYYSRDDLLFLIEDRVSFYLRLEKPHALRVLLRYSNNVEFFLDVLAVWATGGCVIPVDPEIKDAELLNICEFASVDAVVSDQNVSLSTAHSFKREKIALLSLPNLQLASKSKTFNVYSMESSEGYALVLISSGTAREAEDTCSNF